MKKIFVLLSIMTALWSCTSDDFNSDNKSAEKTQMTFNATFENNTTSRASLGEGNTVVWDENDAISVMEVEDGIGSYCSQFALNSGSGTTSGTFTGSITKSTTGYYAAYPYDSKTYIDKNATPYIVWNGSEQIARKGNLPKKCPYGCICCSTS